MYRTSVARGFFAKNNPNRRAATGYSGEIVDANKWFTNNFRRKRLGEGTRGCSLLHPILDLDSAPPDLFEEGFGGDVAFL